MSGKKLKKLSRIDHTWTLFLDRDGVINEQPANDYVKSVEEFHFLPGVKESFQSFNRIFLKIFVVTNQQGIGKGLMTEEQLHEIHNYMKNEIEKQSGHVDKIYFCPGLKKDQPVCRKPGVGMGLQARKEFPGIKLNKSVMVGDMLNDMIFGKRLGMITVLTGEDFKLAQQYPHLVDHYFRSLNDFEKALQYEMNKNQEND